MAAPTINKNKAVSHSTFTIHSYDHRFDAGLAVMWNESDDQWPGTFNGGVAMTEERVRDWMDETGAVMRLVIEEVGTGAITGYADLWEDISRPGSCYVSLINVHPGFQKRSLARRMLTRMVDWAVETGYDRVTLHTWGGNLNAVPLYKKTGFFWRPDTIGHMENYVPAIRQVEALQGFFERHDWYSSYVRELEPVEDRMRHPKTGDMPVYVLNWEAGGEQIEAVIDRNAQALTGLKTDDWSVYARVAESEPAEGIPYAAGWEIANTSGQTLEVTLSVTGDAGIAVSLDQTVVLQPGDSRRIDGHFQVAVDAPKVQLDKPGIPTPGFRTRVRLAGQTLDLHCGLRHRPAVEFSLEPAVVSLVPGQKQTVLLQMHSHAKQPLSGTVGLEVPAGLSVEWPGDPVELEAGGAGSISLDLVAQRGDFYPLGASFAFGDRPRAVTTPVKRLPVAAVQPGGWVAGEIEDQLFIENDTLRLTVKERGGRAELFSKVTRRTEAWLSEELGLPFEPHDLAEQTYEMQLQDTVRSARAKFSAQSTRFPGIRVVRELELSGSPLVRMRVRIENSSDEVCRDLKFQPLSRFRREEYRDVVVPLLLDGAPHVVREHGAVFGLSEGDMPEKPEKYAETWIAWQQPGSVYGMVWAARDLEKVSGWRGNIFPVYAVPELAPGSDYMAPELYLYSGPGDWHAVQALWQRLNGQPPTQPPEAYPPPAGKHLDIGIQPQPLLVLGDTVQANLFAHTTREFKIDGSMEVIAPQGWRAVPAVSKLEAVHNEAPFNAEIRFETVQKRTGAFQGRVQLRSPEKDVESKFTLIRAGLSEHQVEVGPGDEIWRIDNGRTAWEIAPNFSGSVVRWQEKGSEANHLLTTYPDPGQVSWVKPGYGGIRPVLFDYVRDEDWPGRLYTEAFAPEKVEAVDGDGLLWIGVRLHAVMSHKDWKGLLLDIDYLTLPGSNMLKACFRVTNLGGVYRKAEAAFASFFQVDGRFDNGIVHTGEMRFKRTTGMKWPNVGSWAGVENPETGRTIASVIASDFRRQLVLDWGEDGGHLYPFEFLNVPPHGSQRMTAYFALAESLEEARLYGGLAPR